MWNCRRNSILNVFSLVILLQFCLPLQVVFAQEGPKEATEWTRKANRAVLDNPILKWTDKRDFEDAQRGFIAKDSPLTIRDANGNVVFDMEAYTAFIKLNLPAPDTANPSLWRHAQLILLPDYLRSQTESIRCAVMTLPAWELLKAIRDTLLLML